MTKKPETLDVASRSDDPKIYVNRLSKAEKKHISAILNKSLSRPKFEAKDAGKVSEIKISEKDAKAVVAFCQSYGTIDFGIINPQLNHLIQVMGTNDTSSAVTEKISAYMHGLNPQDELQGLLAAQIVATNHVAMRMLARSMEGHPLESANHYTNRAHKAQNLLLRQIELFDRLKNGGNSTQKVVVERVEVQAGGQAVVGAVAGGGGKPPKIEE